ncbi:MAG: cytochrome c3 family protein [Gammaproteobacteria bacterium]
MRCLLRVVKRRSKGIASRQERTLSGDPLRVGRATGQDIFLPNLRVALQHAAINRTREGVIMLRARTLAGVRHNDALVTSAVLRVGDRVEIGPYRLTLLPPPEGFDLALEQEDIGLAADYGQERSAGPGQPAPPRRYGLRAWSWTFALVILALFLVLPLIGAQSPALRGVLRSVFTPLSDAAWNPGALSRNHQHFSSDCAACHERAFVAVRNETCIECHKDQPRHVDDDDVHVAALAEAACTDCHKEHHGSAALIRKDDGLCLDCHRDIKAIASRSKLLDIPSGFSAGHPQLRASLVRHTEGRDQITRVSLNDKPALREHSNLSYSHKVHLDKKGIRGDGQREVLQCASCHQRAAGGRRMAPIRYEPHCHRCHTLTFAMDDPDREVPHGNAKTVLEMLKAYYAMRALEAGGLDVGDTPPATQRERPGTSSAASRPLTAVERAARRAAEVSQTLFKYRVCALCHTVQAASNPARWAINPVRVAETWFPKARFDHGQHQAVECRTCHKVASSDDSVDVLVPGIATCRDCHGGPDTEGKVASNCVSCHGFHLSTRYAMDGKRRKLGRDVPNVEHNDSNQGQGGG